MCLRGRTKSQHLIFDPLSRIDIEYFHVSKSSIFWARELVLWVKFEDLSSVPRTHALEVMHGSICI